MPGHTFDLSYVQLFKSLDNLRNKLQPSVCALLRSLGVGVAREWVSQGRPASPRLLFLFLSAPLALRGDGGRRDERKDAKPNRHPPIKRLEHSLEDQIYRILRKAKIITNVASNSLFAVPSNEAYCYVETGGRGSAMDPEAAAFNTLLTPMARGEVGTVVSSEQGPYYHHHLIEPSREKRCFAHFLRNHINTGFERGFQDNISKHGGVNSGEWLGPPLWEVPTLSEWVVVADALHRMFVLELTSEEGQPNCEAMITLRDDLETEIMFSELLCKKILPAAMALYKEGLPQHYSQEYHQAKLLAAMSLYSQQARGPASEKLAEVRLLHLTPPPHTSTSHLHLTPPPHTSLHTSPPPPPQVLAAECTAYWQAGRQVCEEVSLTGHHCSSRWGLALTLCTKICSRFSLTQDLCISFTGCIRRAPAGGAGGGVAALAVRLRNKIILKHKKLPVSFLVLCDMDASRCGVLICNSNSK